MYSIEVELPSSQEQNRMRIGRESSWHGLLVLRLERVRKVAGDFFPFFYFFIFFENNEVMRWWKEDIWGGLQFDINHVMFGTTNTKRSYKLVKRIKTQKKVY